MSNRTDTGIASLREGLIKARALIDTPDKWCQGSGRNGLSMCTVVAVGSVVGNGSLFDDCCNALSAELPDGYRGGEIKFNDDPTTTHSDIMSLFDRAIARLDVNLFLPLLSSLMEWV